MIIYTVVGGFILKLSIFLKYCEKERKNHLIEIDISQESETTIDRISHTAPTEERIKSVTYIS